jgi:hypothetical protein
VSYVDWEAQQAARDQVALLWASRALLRVLDRSEGAHLELVVAAVREIRKTRQIDALVHLSRICERWGSHLAWEVNRELAELIRQRLPKPERRELLARIDALEGNLRSSGVDRRPFRDHVRTPAPRRARPAPRPAA